MLTEVVGFMAEHGGKVTGSCKGITRFDASDPDFGPYGSDGTIASGTVTQGAGSGSVAGSHAYADNGTYTVTVTVTDDEGASGADTLTLTVTNVAQTRTTQS